MMGGSQRGRSKTVLPSNSCSMNVNKNSFLSAHTMKSQFHKQKHNTAAIDTGCTSHFVQNDVINSKMYHTPMKVRQPDGTTLKSTSKGETKINQTLPKQARLAHGF